MHQIICIYTLIHCYLHPQRNTYSQAKLLADVAEFTGILIYLPDVLFQFQNAADRERDRALLLQHQKQMLLLLFLYLAQ